MHIRVVKVGTHILVEVAAVHVAPTGAVGHVAVPVGVATTFARTDSAGLLAALEEHLVEDNHFLAVQADNHNLEELKDLPVADQVDWGRGRSVGCRQVNHNVPSPTLVVHGFAVAPQLEPCLEAMNKGQKADPVLGSVASVVPQGGP